MEAQRRITESWKELYYNNAAENEKYRKAMHKITMAAIQINYIAATGPQSPEMVAILEEVKIILSGVADSR